VLIEETRSKQIHWSDLKSYTGISKIPVDSLFILHHIQDFLASVEHWAVLIEVQRISETLYLATQVFHFPHTLQHPSFNKHIFSPKHSNIPMYPHVTYLPSPALTLRRAPSQSTRHHLFISNQQSITSDPLGRPSQKRKRRKKIFMRIET
jgi:hypothetical protein